MKITVAGKGGHLYFGCLRVLGSVGQRFCDNVIGSDLERAGISVVGKAANSAEALRYYEDLHADVALVDIDLGGEDGFELAKQLDRVSAASKHLAVILVSTYAESDLDEMISASPAVGFRQKFSLSPDAIRDLLKVSGLQGR